MPAGYEQALRTFRYRLQTWRKRRKLSQRDLGSLTGLSREAIKSYETGRAYPRFESLFRIAVALGCSLADLIEGYRDVPATAPGEEMRRLRTTLAEHGRLLRRLAGNGRRRSR
jgi:transcriptional regulator with XRE-family HTH domain